MMDCIQMRWLHVLGLLLACDIDVVGKRNGAFYHYIARFLYFFGFLGSFGMKVC